MPCCADLNSLVYFLVSCHRCACVRPNRCSKLKKPSTLTTYIHTPARTHPFMRAPHTHTCANACKHTPTSALSPTCNTDARTHTHPHVVTQFKISYSKYWGILICNCLSPSSESLFQGKECLAFKDNYRREILPVIFGREENGYKRNHFYVTASSTHIDPRRFLELIVINCLISCLECSAQAGEAAILGTAVCRAVRCMRAHLRGAWARVSDGGASFAHHKCSLLHPVAWSALSSSSNMLSQVSFAASPNH